MFKKREKSKEREPNLLREIANVLEQETPPPPPNSLRMDEIYPPAPENNINMEEDIAGNNEYGRRTRDNSVTRSEAKSNYSNSINLDREFQRLGKDIHFRNTATDPLGRMLFELTLQVRRICKKIDVPYGKDPEETCEEYSDHLDGLSRHIQDKVVTTVSEAVKTAIKVQNELKLRNCFKDHTETLFPPRFYAPQDILTSDHKQNNANGYFPLRPKFSGNGAIALTEFLRNLNMAQEKVVCSEREFKEYILRCTTGIVFEDLATIVDGGGTIEDMYDNLINNYDTRKPPSKAKEELEQYKPAPNATLQAVKSKIMSLGQRAKLMYAEKARTDSYNFDTVHALLRSLPKASYQRGFETYTQLTQELDAMPTFKQFTDALTPQQPVIDLNYKLEGSKRVATTEISRQGKTFNPNPFRRAEPFRKHGRAKIQQINSRAPPAYDNRNKDRQVSSSNQHRSPSYNQGPRKGSRNDVENSFHDPAGWKDTRSYVGRGFKQHVRPHANEGRNNYQKQSGRFEVKNDRHGFSNKRGNSNTTELGARGKLHCSLCGSSTHAAAQGCFQMRNDAGRLVFCPPSQGHCARCEKEMGKVLFHPEEFCFNRPAIKKLREQGKMGYPSPDERRQFQEYINNGH